MKLYLKVDFFCRSPFLIIVSKSTTVGVLLIVFKMDICGILVDFRFIYESLSFVPNVCNSSNEDLNKL